MYAIIRTGGKQYKVKAGETLRVEKLDKELGDKFDIEEVLFIGGEKPVFGEPTVKGAKVQVVVTQQDRGAKILVFKKKRRKGYRKMQGHRQDYTALFIESIVSPSGETVNAETKAHVIDPVKTAERKAKIAAELAETAKTTGEKPVVSAKKAKTAKKASKKAAPKKKSSGAKKKTGAKKTAKKTKAKSKK